MHLRHSMISILSISLCAIAATGQSYYDAKPNDPLAVYLTKDLRDSFGAHADGLGDDADVLQRAIDHVQETTHYGVVFIPEGRYRLAKTVHVWSGIRLIGFGKHRPVLVLAQNTPGFQQGPDRYMLWFTDERTPVGTPIADASEFTFYSAASNIDFDLGEGNPAAVAVRFNVAQHGFLSHINFHLSSARAAIEAVGNQASDIHIEGGEYGIVTGKTSPAWQFLLMDSSLEGQHKAAISTHEAGFTLVRVQFAHTPVAIEIPAGHVEQLYGRDLTMKDISLAALVLGDVQNLRSEITLENIACAHVPHFITNAPNVKGGEAIVNRSPYFVEEHFSVGLDVGPDGREHEVAMHHREHALKSEPASVPTDIPALPVVSSWIDVRSLGVKGDGATDDTAAIQRAIDTHATLFLPSGMYRLTNSLHLRPETILIGFNPATTQLTLFDGTSEFQGSGSTMPLLVAPHGGSNIVSGIGFSTGDANPRASGVEWLAGSHSLLDDVSFIRGHTSYNALLAPAAPKPIPGQQRPAMRLDAQYASLWVHDGGGGILRGVWSHAGTAHQGLLVQNTTTPASIYQFSCEHHMQEEVRLEHVANWRIYDLQTEEEKPEGADAVAIQIQDSRDIHFANTYLYRVSRNVIPKLYAIVSRRSVGIEFANVKVFSQTRLAFDNSFFDAGSEVSVRAHDFTTFQVDNELHRGEPLPIPSVFASGASLKKLATGYSNTSGLTVDRAGKIYFTDAAMHSIYSWNESQHQVKLLAKIDGSPMVLGFAGNSTLLAINNEKSVVSVRTDTGAAASINEAPSPVANAVLLLPVGLHNELWTLSAILQHVGYTFRVGSNTALRSGLLPEHRGYFYAPGTTTAIMAGGTWRLLLQSSQLAPYVIGDRHYIVSEDEGVTYTSQLMDGEILATSLFAQRGGTSVVSDVDGNVYIAGSQVYVYNSAGHEIGMLEVPERPSSLCFGGPDHRTLYVGARSSLYSIRTAAPGK